MPLPSPEPADPLETILARHPLLSISKQKNGQYRATGIGPGTKWPQAWGDTAQGALAALIREMG